MVVALLEVAVVVATLEEVALVPGAVLGCAVVGDKAVHDCHCR